VAADVLTAFRDHLILAGLVRKPSTAGPQHPLWLERAEGVPAPGEREAPERDDLLVLGAFLTNGVAPSRFESWWRQPIVDVRFRGRARGMGGVDAIQDTEHAISGAVIDRVDWTMGGLYVVESEQFQALQRLGSDEQSFDYFTSYRFILYRD
jgi:hypothetical protein